MWARRVRRGLIAALLGALAFSGWTAWREWRAEQIEAMAHRLVAAVVAPGAEARLDSLIRACGVQCPARGLEAAAAAKAALAARASGEERLALYAEAELLARRGLARNPVSAEGWARLAMILSERAGGAPSPLAVGALRTSYSAAPFSRGAAVWRIGFCASHWPIIEPGLRRHAVDELVWLAGVDRSLAEHLVAQIQDDTAKFAFGLALSVRAKPAN